MMLWEDYQGNRYTRQLQSNTPIIRARSEVRSARSQNLGAAWPYDLAQWRQYRLAMAKTDEERQAIEAEYASASSKARISANHRPLSGRNDAETICA
jgi:hypothetical protein